MDETKTLETPDPALSPIETRLNENRVPGQERASGRPPETPVPAGKASSRRLRRPVAIAFVVLLVIAGAVGYWYTQRNLQSTDDAFIDGNTITISPRISGAVERLHFTDNQLVQKGDPLIDIDQRDYRAALDNAEAMLAEAEARQAVAAADLDLTRASTAATLAQAQSQLAEARSAFSQAQAQAVASQSEADRAAADVPRYEATAKAGAASRERLDEVIAAARITKARLEAAKQAVSVAQAKITEAEAGVEQAKTAEQQIAVKEADLKAAQALVAAAKAAVEQASLNLSYTRIFAPETGYITRRAVNAGDIVQKDQVLTSLVFGEPWVTANFKESELTRMRPGQPVRIEIDAYPDAVFNGRVESIQRGTGAHFSLLPPENATGNYVKVVQRVPVKIVFDQPPDPRFVLGLGMSVVPTVDVAASVPAEAAKDGGH